MPSTAIAPSTASTIASASGRWARSWSLTSSRQADRTATRPRPDLVLRLDRWAREDLDRRRVAIPTNVTPAPPAPVVSPPGRGDASQTHTVCGPGTQRGLERADVAAVDGIHLAGDPARGVAAEQGHERRRVLRLPHSRDRVVPGQLPFELGVGLEGLG